MGLFDVVRRIRTVFSDKSEELPKMSYKSLGLFDLYGLGTLGKTLKIDDDLMVRFADYEEMDDYPIIACFSGQTIVHTVGGPVTIKELSEKIGVNGKVLLYAYDLKSEEIVVAEAHSPRKTGEKVKTIKVVLDDDRFIRVTPEHLFLMRDGSYREAINLKPYDSLMPFYQRIGKHGYVEILNIDKSGTDKRWERRYRMVARFKYPDYGKTDKLFHIHHADFNELNDRPDNLDMLTPKDHVKIHGEFINHVMPEWTDERRRNYSLKIRMANGDKSGKGRNIASDSVDIESLPKKRKNKNISRGDILKSLRISCSINEAADRIGVDWNWMKRWAIRYGINIDDVIASDLDSVNHKVLRIEDGEEEDVYDITTPVFCNLAVNGVFAHNSAYDILADDCTSEDFIEKKVVWAESENKKIESHLRNMMQRVRLSDSIWEIARTVMKYGNDYEYVDVDENGIRNLVYFPPPAMRRAEKGGESAFWVDQVGTSNYQDEQIFDKIKLVKDGSDQSQSNLIPATVFEGWQIIHWRNRVKNRGSRYGYAYGENSRWIWKRLVMMEDAALIFRLTRAPSRNVYYLDVGSLPPSEALAYVEKVKQKLKRSRFVNSRTGKIDLRFNPMNETDDIYLPVREGKDRTRVEALQGPESQMMDDVEFFLKKLFSSLRIPKSYLGYDDNIGSRFILTAEDVRYARTVMRLQSVLRTGIRQACDIELAAKNIVPASVPFEVKMSVPSKVFETSYLELMNMRMDLANGMRDTFSMQWIFEHVFKFTPSQISAIVGQKGKETLDQADVDNDVLEKRLEIEGKAAIMTGGAGGADGGKRFPQRPTSSESALFGGNGRYLNERMSGNRLLFTDEEFTKGNGRKEREMNGKIEEMIFNDRKIMSRIDNMRGLLVDIMKNKRTSRFQEEPDGTL